MKKKKGIASWVAVSICSVFLLALLFLMSGIAVCAEKPAAPSKTYNWKMTAFFPKGNTTNRSVADFINNLEQRSNGAVKITFYESTLGAMTDHWDMAKGNVVQLAYLAEAAAPGRLPIITLQTLPFEFDSVAEGMNASNEMWKAGYLKEVTDSFHLVAFFPNLHIQTLFFRNKKVTKLEDMKGLKIRAASSLIGKTVTALGAAGVNMPGSELYMALQTGVIDGFVTGADFIPDQKLYEVAKYALQEPLFAGVFFLVMNKELWNSLPKDLQTLIDKTAAESSEKFTTKIFPPEQQQTWDTMVAKKMEVYRLSPDEKARWKQAVASIGDSYVQEQSAKGFPAKAALELMRKVAAGKK